jgi:hypothetical protein
MQRIVRRNDRAKQEASKTKRRHTLVAARRRVVRKITTDDRVGENYFSTISLFRLENSLRISFLSLSATSAFPIASHLYLQSAVERLRFTIDRRDIFFSDESDWATVGQSYLEPVAAAFEDTEPSIFADFTNAVRCEARIVPDR